MSLLRGGVFFILSLFFSSYALAEDKEMTQKEVEEAIINNLEFYYYMEASEMIELLDDDSAMESLEEMVANEEDSENE